MYYFLWQLYHLQQDESEGLQQQQRLADELLELTNRNASFDAAMSEHKKQQSALVRERMTVEKEQKKLQKKQEKKVHVSRVDQPLLGVACPAVMATQQPSLHVLQSALEQLQHL